MQQDFKEKFEILMVGERIAPQGHFLALRAQGTTPACGLVRNDREILLRYSPVSSQEITKRSLLCHCEERSDVAIRIPRPIT
jgi:hypothetical protein